MSHPDRVMQVLSSTTRGGVETLVMNWYRQIDRERLQFDFIVHDQFNHDYDEEILELGGRIFKLPLLSKVGMRPFMSMVEDALKEHGPYIAIHAHTDYQAGFSAWAAKSLGIERRFCHAHTKYLRMNSPALRSKIMLGRMVTFSNASKLFACSALAGRIIYGERAMENGRVELLNNGIDLNPFTKREDGMKEKLCAELNLPKHARLIGHVARINPIKNHDFTLEIAKVIRERGLPWVILCVGGGSSCREFEEKCARMHIKDTVKFLGSRDDVARIMMCLDAAILPSIAEGLSMTTVEMQAAGVPILVSSTIPKETDMDIGLFYQRKLKDGPKLWVNDLMNMVQQQENDKAYCVRAVAQKGYDNIISSQRIASQYLGEN